MIEKQLSKIALSDIEALVTDQIHEGRRLEFKSELKVAKDEEKREFLADVPALANTLGGDLIYGITEDGGRATHLAPIDLTDFDATRLQLESMVRSNIDPRLPHFDTQWLATEEGRGVLIIRVEKSWAAPHRVTFRDHSKFYGRTSAGKYPLDVGELRAAFLASEALEDRVRVFRRDRTLILESEDSVVPMNAGPKMLLHVLPLSSFVNPERLDLNRCERRLTPPGGRGASPLPTLEGLLTYSGPEDMAETVRAYVLVFREGMMEVAADIGHRREDGSWWVRPRLLHGYLGDRIPEYFAYLSGLEVKPPFYVSLTLTSVRGTRLRLPREQFDEFRFSPLRRDSLAIPLIQVDELNRPIEDLARPMLDLVWQSYGLPGFVNLNQCP